MSPRTHNTSSPRPSLSTAYDGNLLWPTLWQLALSPLPSPGVSKYSGDNIAEGLLDPKLPWWFDSSANLRNHEDYYSRPIRGTARLFFFSF